MKYDVINQGSMYMPQDKKLKYANNSKINKNKITVKNYSIQYLVTYLINY